MIVMPVRGLAVHFSHPIQMEELLHTVPQPKEMDVLYKLMYPFRFNVWMATGIVCIVGCIVMLMTATAFSEIAQVKETSDYVFHPMGMLIEPLSNDVPWIKNLVQFTRSGYILIYVWVLGGFFIGACYKSTLLAHLTSISYEKQISSIEGLQRFS